MFPAKTKYSKRPIRIEILKEARSWIDTPYRHQGRVKHVGVDCVGLIAMVGINLGILNLTISELEKYSNYARLPNPAKMGKLLKEHLCEISKASLGDIVWIEWRRNLPMHLALLGEFKNRTTLIHAAGNIGKVVEHTLTHEWRSRIAGRFRYPGLI